MIDDQPWVAPDGLEHATEHAVVLIEAGGHRMSWPRLFEAQSSGPRDVWPTL